MTDDRTNAQKFADAILKNANPENWHTSPGSAIWAGNDPLLNQDAPSNGTTDHTNGDTK